MAQSMGLTCSKKVRKKLVINMFKQQRLNKTKNLMMKETIICKTSICLLKLNFILRLRNRLTFTFFHPIF